MNIVRLDHLVLTVMDVEKTCAFYCGVLGMKRMTFSEDRTALHFGHQKINLHAFDWDYYLKAKTPTPGSADLCFIVDIAVDEWVTELAEKEIQLIEGPVKRTGAAGPLRSIYFRDPDGNLIELSNALTGEEDD
jgi:catechol 2,3-dioxygenase-like lactoylglutathione lyase family enzyme